MRYQGWPEDQPCRTDDGPKAPAQAAGFPSNRRGPMKKLTLALTVALLLTVATAVPAFARGGPPPFQADHHASQHAPELTPGLLLFCLG